MYRFNEALFYCEIHSFFAYFVQPHQIYTTYVSPLESVCSTSSSTEVSWAGHRAQLT